jgi:hypothetical protein
MSAFECDLTLWVGLCIAVGTALGHSSRCFNARSIGGESGVRRNPDRRSDVESARCECVIVWIGGLPWRDSSDVSLSLEIRRSERRRSRDCAESRGHSRAAGANGGADRRHRHRFRTNSGTYRPCSTLAQSGPGPVGINRAAPGGDTVSAGCCDERCPGRRSFCLGRMGLVIAPQIGMELETSLRVAAHGNSVRAVRPSY